MNVRAAMTPAQRTGDGRMNRTAFATSLLLAATLLCPAGAQATANLTLSFFGTVTPGSGETIHAYESDNDDRIRTAFDGQPAVITIHVVSSHEGKYIDWFGLNWSNQTYALPFETGWSDHAGAPPSKVDDRGVDFGSTLLLSKSGGSLGLWASSDYISYTDGEFALSLNYAKLGAKRITGSGRFEFWEGNFWDPQIPGGVYNESGGIGFTLDRFSRSGPVPEPSTWSMLLLGIGGLGAMLRTRRRILAASMT
jgi:hypothetical protein